MHNPSQPITLNASRAKMLGLLVLSLAFVAASTFVMQDNFWTGLLCAAFFGAGSVVCLVNLTLGASHLHIAGDGLIIRTLFVDRRIPWKHIESFGVFWHRFRGIPLSKRVGIHFAPTYSIAMRFRKLNKALLGVEHGFQDSYGLNADELAQLLNERLNDWKQSHKESL